MKEAYNPGMEFFSILEKDFIPALKSGNTTKAGEIAYGILGEKYQLHRQKIDSLVKIAINISNENEKNAGKVLANHMNFLNLFSLAILTICSFVAFFLGKSITRPIAKTIEFSERIAIGDTSVVSQENRTDEFGALNHSMNKMAENLNSTALLASKVASGDFTADVIPLSEKDNFGIAMKKMVEKLKIIISDFLSIADSIASGSEELSSASQAMSKGITLQASSIEEISATVNEIAGQAKNNSKNASDANGFAKEAHSLANTGNSEMKNLMQAMSQINNSTGKISKVIKVIDDIAFQTNLLSLNAAVEAARAGQQGKGFAVVSLEVRNLANKSAQSAKESAELIEQAVQNVKDGLNTAQKTASILEEILNSNIKVSTLLAGISSSSEEQAKGIIQVNEGIDLISKVTQENTATAEETASTAEEMSSQAQNLARSLEFFKVKKS
ncbi:MAG: methyl-accepting chemotaxis protein [Candidatus Riflebacteria bacterium]